MDENKNSIANERYRKLFYKYCFYCKECQRYQMEALYSASLPKNPTHCVFHHLYVCCKEKEEIKKIEEEISSIEEERKEKT